MKELTNEDIKNILVLISRANITGQEATATAILQSKLSKLLTPEVDPITAGGTEPVDENINKEGTK